MTGTGMTTMNRRRFTGLGLIVASVPFLGGWMWGKRGKPQTDAELKRWGFIVAIDSYDATLKGNAIGVTDAGARIILQGFNQGGAQSAFSAGTSGGRFPRWVHVTYRGPFDHVGATEKWWDKGEILAEYHIEVLSRIPEEVFEYVLAKREQPESGGRILRAIRLKFRITDNGVLFGWDVEERIVDGPKDSQGRRLNRRPPNYAMAGGDFLGDAGPFANRKKKPD